MVVYYIQPSVFNSLENLNIFNSSFIFLSLNLACSKGLPLLQALRYCTVIDHSYLIYLKLCFVVEWYGTLQWCVLSRGLKSGKKGFARLSLTIYAAIYYLVC